MVHVLFRKVDYTVRKLIEDIDIGEIGLPDIQRPFVWKAAKVRDLFDSMYRGYPIGYLLFWENGYPGEHRTIGNNAKQKIPRLLVVDGQQRLTALFAVMKGREITDQRYRHRRLRIGFHPLEERFEVTNSAIRRSPEWIADISELWQPGFSSYTFINGFIEQLRQSQELSAEAKERISEVINHLRQLQDYPITALEVSSTVDEEQVAEIFVRINSKGTPLRQADFILTLMSVFWDEGRAELEAFCRAAKKPPADHHPSPYNPYLQPNPDQLLRVSVALGFRRARLEHVYSLLRGKDLQTRQFSVAQRERQFALLREAQAYTLDIQNWHEFFKVLQRAGYPDQSLISSRVAVLYTYALWLIGRRDFKVPLYALREIMAKWFFMVALTGRYTGSPEARMEQDLALLRGKQEPEAFIQVLEQQIAAVLTEDYWTVTLPNELEAASARNTEQLAFYASLYILGAPVLYSRMKVAELLAPSIRARKSALERHHLFPRDYLSRLGYEKRLINQTANYALVEWSDNIAISNRPPQAYVPEMESRFTADELREMYHFHALPERWYQMEYTEFLEARRKRMAAVIREGFMRIGVITGQR